MLLPGNYSGQLLSIMEISEDLTKTAREYNPHIDYVAFLDMNNTDFGRVRRSRNEVEKYRIHIDKSRLVCPTQVLFVFYHELGHIERFHLGYRYFDTRLSMQARENEADVWAFKEMGIMDCQERISEKYRPCHECITRFFASEEFVITTQGKCLRGVRLTGHI